MEDIELIEGLVFDHKTGGTGGPSKVEKAKVGLIQFCISPPKTDVGICLVRPNKKNKCVSGDR